MTKYLPLNEDFVSNGYHHKQVTREGDLVVYERTCLAYPKEPMHWETVVVQRRDSFEAFGRTFPASEYYPSSKSWGDLGWTFTTRDEALNRLNELRGKRVSRVHHSHYTRPDRPGVSK